MDQQPQLPADFLKQLAPPQKKMSGGMIAIIVLLAILILIGSGCLWKLSGPQNQTIGPSSSNPSQTNQPTDDPNFTPI